MVAPDPVQSMGKIEQNRGFESLQFFAFKLRTYTFNCIALLAGVVEYTDCKTPTQPAFAQSAGAVEYTDCFSAEG